MLKLIQNYINPNGFAVKIKSKQMFYNRRENKPEIGPPLQNIEVKQTASLEIGAKYNKKHLFDSLGMNSLFSEK
jgi:hypothetical protein